MSRSITRITAAKAAIDKAIESLEEIIPLIGEGLIGKGPDEVAACTDTIRTMLAVIEAENKELPS